jgi:hypothetical protein
LHAENAPDRTGSGSYRAAYDRADWPGCPASLCRSFLRATDRALCACWTRSNQCTEQQRTNYGTNSCVSHKPLQVVISTGHTTSPRQRRSYRIKAKEHAERTEAARDPEAKRTYEDMARQGLDLAKEAEASGGY